VNDDLVLVEPGGVGDALARVFWVARDSEGLGSVEGDRSADLLVNFGLGALEGSLFSIGGLLVGRLGGTI